VKDIFQRKVFWVTLLILLLAVFVYLPFMESRRGFGSYRFWGWFFLSSGAEVDLKMLLVETIIAILLTIGICLIPFGKIGMLLGFIWSGIWGD
jgi:hypothetical protein